MFFTSVSYSYDRLCHARLANTAIITKVLDVAAGGHQSFSYTAEHNCGINTGALRAVSIALRFPFHALRLCKAVLVN